MQMRDNHPFLIETAIASSGLTIQTRPKKKKPWNKEKLY